METIKVTNTKLHETSYIDFKGLPFKVPVAEGKLILVECKPEEAVLWQKQDQLEWVQLYDYSKGLIKGLGKYHKPIIISETEKIEVGDWIYDTDLKNIKQATELQARIASKGFSYYLKILALPEHFSFKHLHAIVDGKLKDDDKVLAECEEMVEAQFINLEELEKVGEFAQIKLNQSNHITLHKVKEKMYTREEVDKIIAQTFHGGYNQGIWHGRKQMCEVFNHTGAYLTGARDNHKYYSTQGIEWFEQNVKP